MAFDQDIPTSGTSLRASNPQILENQESIQEALDNEHIFTGTSAGTQTGYHTQGSVRCFYEANPGPTTRIDTTGFEAADLGSVWFSTTDNSFNILTATTPTWTPVSDEVIATLLATNRVFAGTLGVDGNFTVNSNFDVTASNGNTLVGGTLDVTGNIDPTSYETTNGGFFDEDNMASDSATSTASQQSIKAYVDDLFDLGLAGVSDSNGEIKIGDLEVKWGSGSVNELSVTALTFAGNFAISAFTEHCFQVIICDGEQAFSSSESLRVWSITKNGFTVGNGFDSPGTATRKIRFIAVGR